MKRWVIGLFGFLAACDTGPLMTPGQDCQQSGCHGPDQGRRAFSLSGTVFPQIGSVAESGSSNVTIIVTDAQGKTTNLTSNAAGNFYTDDALTFPVFVAVQAGTTVRHMEPSLTYGGCNQCHDIPPTGSAGGRVFVSAQ